MVTTFLTECDYRASARNLDQQRLGKQRTEAWQIWLVHRDLRVLAEYFDLPEQPPEKPDPIEYFLGAQEWADTVIATYKRQDFLLAIEPPFLTIIPKTEEKLYRSVSASVPYRYLDDSSQSSFSNEALLEIGAGKNKYIWPRSQTFLAAEGERLIKLGFVNHPASRMWLGYSESLLDYFNAHVEVWSEQGHRNITLAVIPLESKPFKPFWVGSALIENHRAVLYGKKPEFYTQWQSEPTEYIWPSQLLPEQMTDL